MPAKATSKGCSSIVENTDEEAILNQKMEELRQLREKYPMLQGKALDAKMNPKRLEILLALDAGRALGSGYQKPSMPTNVDLSSIGIAELHEMTGINKLSQIDKFELVDIVRFGTWVMEQGYEQNPHFLALFESQKKNKLWQHYCAGEIQHSKRYLLLRLALYLGLEIDVYLDSECQRVEPNEQPAEEGESRPAKCRQSGD